MQRGPKYGGNSSLPLLPFLVPQRKQETALSSSVCPGEELDAQSRPRRTRCSRMAEDLGSCRAMKKERDPGLVVARITMRRTVVTDVCTHSGYEKQFGDEKNLKH